MTTEKKMTDEEAAEFLGLVKKETKRILAKTLPDATKFWDDKGLSAHVPVGYLRHAYLMGIGAAVTYILAETHEEPSEPKP